MSKKMTEPLPCPWCGRVPTVTRTNSPAFRKYPWQVACPRPQRPACPVSPYGGIYATRERAVAMWNRRKRPAVGEEEKG